MRFVDSWFLRAGFAVLLLSVAFLLAGSLLHSYWAPLVERVSIWEMIAAFSVLGLQIGSVLMIIGVVMTLYRKAQIRNPRLH
jgi:hypothetical protein